MKCVIIIDHSLPLGLIANTSAVLAMGIGHNVKDIVGEDVVDQDGTVHRGITQVSIPVLKGDEALLRSIRARLVEMEGDGLFCVDFCDVAQKSRNYDQYKTHLQQTSADAFNYLGIAIYGPDKDVSSLTGHLGLLR